MTRVTYQGTSLGVRFALADHFARGLAECFESDAGHVARNAAIRRALPLQHDATSATIGQLSDTCQSV
jgi:hypothetical protein